MADAVWGTVYFTVCMIVALFVSFFFEHEGKYLKALRRIVPESVALLFFGAVCACVPVCVRHVETSTDQPGVRGVAASVARRRLDPDDNVI